MPKPLGPVTTSTIQPLSEPTQKEGSGTTGTSQGKRVRAVQTQKTMPHNRSGKLELRRLGSKPLSERTVSSLPSSIGATNESTPSTSRAPVMAVLGITLDESLNQEEAESIIAEFGKGTSPVLDIHSEETIRLLSALNKTGQRLTLAPTLYKKALRECPELIWGRFVISENDIVSNHLSKNPPKIFLEHGTHPSSIMSSMLEILTDQPGHTQLCLEERQSYYEAMLVTAILNGYEDRSGDNSELTKKFEDIRKRGEVLDQSPDRIYADNPMINAELRASKREELLALAREVNPELTEQGLAITHYLSNPLNTLPELAHIGQKVMANFEAQAEKNGEPDTRFPHHYFDQEFTYDRLNDRTTDNIKEELLGISPRFSEVQHLALDKRSEGVFYPYPVMNRDGTSKMDTWIGQHKLHQSLALATGKDGKVSPQFLGFVEPARANQVVISHGSFRDHALSDNILHTKNVHDLQMALLRDKGLMDEEFQKKMFAASGTQLSLWQALFDRNCISPSADAYIGDHAIQHPCLSLGAPSSLYPLLSSQQISRSLTLFADQAPLETLAPLYQKLHPDAAVNTEENMRSALRTMAEQINAVEVAMISSNYKDLVKAGNETAPAFAERFESEGKGYRQQHPALKAIEMYGKVSNLHSCNFIGDEEMADLGKNVYESKVLRDENGEMMENADGSCYLLPDGHLITKDFTILYKVRSLS
ncbi:hypothetical protein [Parendozoicomonas haliclonae]|uniref:Uncharacterized protein n=1 Tax=Parendozoicomonas haliclonae TaxID=1960125 RepID=A0A1X7AIC1_9GAMM|nr:hypothetical protein [Parendozoicomonas haliclonae]SMA43424.1 hypothetical protein EHSB41UT_01583 [Parendozoicomonas haliclonae]